MHLTTTEVALIAGLGGAVIGAASTGFIAAWSMHVQRQEWREQRGYDKEQREAQRQHERRLSQEDRASAYRRELYVKLVARLDEAMAGIENNTFAPESYVLGGVGAPDFRLLTDVRVLASPAVRGLMDDWGLARQHLHDYTEALEAARHELAAGMRPDAAEEVEHQRVWRVELRKRAAALRARAASELSGEHEISELLDLAAQRGHHVDVPKQQT